MKSVNTEIGNIRCQSVITDFVQNFKATIWSSTLSYYPTGVKKHHNFSSLEQFVIHAPNRMAPMISVEQELIRI